MAYIFPALFPDTEVNYLRMVKMNPGKFEIWISEHEVELRALLNLPLGLK